jgi:ribosomal protein S18 acetylase RimI-like enzyme
MAIVEKKTKFTNLHVAIDPEYYAPSSNADEEFKNYVEKRINDPDFKVFIAKDNGNFIGYVMGWIEYRPAIYLKRKCGYLSNIYIDETYQKQEIGKRLYHSIEDWFKEKNVDVIEIKADARNNTAIQRFKQYGFNELSITFYKYPSSDTHE